MDSVLQRNDPSQIKNQFDGAGRIKKERWLSWLKAPHSKRGKLERVSGVQISPSPPSLAGASYGGQSPQVDREGELKNYAK